MILVVILGLSLFNKTIGREEMSRRGMRYKDVYDRTRENISCYAVPQDSPSFVSDYSSTVYPEVIRYLSSFKHHLVEFY